MKDKSDQTLPLNGAVDSPEEDHMLDENKRPEWSNRFQYILSLLGYSVGLGNLWRFPYVCQRNGGGAFLIPYVIVTFIFAMPLFYLEVCLGQLSRSGPILVWGLCPLMAGIGFSMLILNLLLLPYYTQTLTWGLYYLYNSFSPVLPWTTCGNTWNTPQCVAVGDRVADRNATLFNVTEDGIMLQEALARYRNSSHGHSSTEEFWQYNTLAVSSGLEELGSMQPHLLLCWFLACLAVFLCLIKGVQSLGKVVYVTALVPYVLLTVLLVKSCTMPGAVDGILYYLTPDFTRLKHPQVWLEALIQLFFSLGPAWGPLIVMASHNPSNKNTVSNTVIVCVCGEMTSFFAGLVVFSTVGYLAHSLDLPVADVITSGPGIGFIVYPEAASILPVPQLWSVLFFLVLIMMGVDTVFANFEAAVACLEDIWPRRFSSNHLPAKLGGIVALFMFLVGLVFTTNGGIYVFTLMDWYVATCICFLVSLFECVVVSWLYGMKQFSADIENMTGRRIPVIFKVVVAILIPVILLLMIIITLTIYKPPTYGEYIYPEYTASIGWCIAFASVVPIPLCMLVQVFRQEGSLWKRLEHTLRPNLHWQRARRRIGCEVNPKPVSFKNNLIFMFSSGK